MKIKLKTICIFILVLCVITIVSNNVYAAGSFSVYINKASLKPGETATLTVKTTNCAGKFSISSSNSSVATVSTSSTWIDGSVTITITAKKDGSANIIVTPVDVTDSDLNDITGSKSASITVKTPIANSTTPPSTTTTTKPSTNTSNKSSTTTNKTGTTSKTTTTKSVSSNAFLKEFRVDSPGITPAFSKTIYNYAITVGENVDKLNVTAVPEDSKATINISGNVGLKTGDNTITVRVTAEDKKTVKTYKVIVTKTDDPIKSNAYLQNIIITNATFTPEFSSEEFNYDCGKVKSDIEKLDVTAFPVNEKAKVDITGNDKLEAGENVIKITVTSENSKVQKVYTIKVNKEENKIVLATNETENSSKNKIEESSPFKSMKQILKEKSAILFLYAFVWIEFLQVVYLYEKLNKRDNITIK